MVFAALVGAMALEVVSGAPPRPPMLLAEITLHATCVPASSTGDTLRLDCVAPPARQAAAPRAPSEEVAMAVARRPPRQGLIEVVTAGGSTDAPDRTPSR